MKIKGSIALSLLLFMEVYFFISIRHFAPGSIIDEQGDFKLFYLLYWVLHISIILFLYFYFFLEKEKVRAKHLFLIITLFICLKIIFDFIFAKYSVNKPNIYLFEIGRVFFFWEIVFQAILYILFGISAIVCGYRYSFASKNCLKIIFLMFGIVGCLILAKSLNDGFEYIGLYSDVKTVDGVSVVSAFMCNMIFKNYISFHMFLIILSNFKKRAGKCV